MIPPAKGYHFKVLVFFEELTIYEIIDRDRHVIILSEMLNNLYNIFYRLYNIASTSYRESRLNLLCILGIVKEGVSWATYPVTLQHGDSIETRATQFPRMFFIIYADYTTSLHCLTLDYLGAVSSGTNVFR